MNLESAQHKDMKKNYQRKTLMKILIMNAFINIKR